MVFGAGETLERRQGPQISALGVCRDAARSSRSRRVKASGLRWASLMWLGRIPWAGRHWALPGQTGRPRVKGVPPPTLKKLLNQPAAAWTTAPVA